MRRIVRHATVEDVREAVLSQEQVAQNPELLRVLAGGPQLLQVYDGVYAILTPLQL